MPKTPATYEDNPNLYYFPPGATEPVLKTPEMVQSERDTDDDEEDTDDDELEDETDTEELDEDTDSSAGVKVTKPAGKKGTVGARGRPKGSASQKSAARKK